MQVILIIGITGGCRCEEMLNINVNDVIDIGTSINIKVRETKTNLYRFFNITDTLSVNIIKYYISKRPGGMDNKRFLLRYDNDRCLRVVLGIQTISNVPKKVASFLNLTKIEEYTGHCLHRTAAAFNN